jgi:hypothetical protein
MGTNLSAERSDETSRLPGVVELPAPTAWPLALSFGVTLLFAGLLTNVSLSLLGLVLVVAGCTGWFREVLPHEKEVTVPVVPAELRIVTRLLSVFQSRQNLFEPGFRSRPIQYRPA